PGAMGLFRLMLLQESRRPARASPAGELILLADQDRSRWNRAQIAEGSALAARALAGPRVGSYALPAGIAAGQRAAATPAATDWGRIVTMYDLLMQADPSPVV